MYGVKVFESWPSVILGAVLFAGLFTLVALLTEAVFTGRPAVTGWVVSLGVTSFVGYLGVAQFLRYTDKRT